MTDAERVAKTERILWLNDFPDLVQPGLDLSYTIESAAVRAYIGRLRGAISEARAALSVSVRRPT